MAKLGMTPGDDPVPNMPKSAVDGMFIYGITGLYVDDIIYI